MPAGCWYELIAQGLDATGELAEEPADYGDGDGAALPQAAPDGIAASQPTAPAGPSRRRRCRAGCTTKVAGRAGARGADQAVRLRR